MAAGAIKRLHTQFLDIDITIADIDVYKANEVAEQVNGTGAQFDATDPESIENVIVREEIVALIE